MPARVLVNIDVADLERAIAFYTDGLGLRFGRRLFDGVAEMEGAPVPVYLLEKPADSAAAPDGAIRRSFERHWTPVHLDFTVPDIHAAVHRAQAAGARLESGIESRAWGHMATLSDPFGNGFCLIAFIGRGYDDMSG